jgi:hypothetical protein
MIAWIASFLPVGSAYTRTGTQTEREYFSQASFNLTRGFSLDPGPDAKGSMWSRWRTLLLHYPNDARQRDK